MVTAQPDKTGMHILLKLVRIYGLINTVSPVPQPASAFKDGVKRDPADQIGRAHV